MSKDGEVILLDVVLRHFVSELKDALVFDVTFKSVVGLLLKGSLCATFGPLGAIFPDIATFFAKVGYKSAQEIYNVRRTSSGLIIAERERSVISSHSPTQMPEHYEIPLTDLMTPGQFAGKFRPLNLRDTNTIHNILGVDRQKCNECGNYIIWSFSHALHCSQNPFKTTASSTSSQTRCPVCGNHIFREFGHTDDCLLNPLSVPPSYSGNLLTDLKSPFQESFVLPTITSKMSLCIECGRIISKPQDHLPTCSKNPSHPFLTQCSECGAYVTGLQGHLPTCSKNPLHPFLTQCSECGAYVTGLQGHLPTCSKNPLHPLPAMTLSLCHECSRIISKPQDHLPTCSKNPSHPFLTQCSECGAYVTGLQGHLPTCSKNPPIYSFSSPVDVSPSLKWCHECASLILKPENHKLTCSEHPFNRGF